MRNQKKTMILQMCCRSRSPSTTTTFKLPVVWRKQVGFNAGIGTFQPVGRSECSSLEGKGRSDGPDTDLAAEKKYGEFRKGERLKECSIPLRTLGRSVAERVSRSSQGFAHRVLTGTLISYLSPLPHSSSSFTSSALRVEWSLYLGRETRQRSWYVPIGCARYVPKFARDRRLAWSLSGVVLVTQTQFIGCVYTVAEATFQGIGTCLLRLAAHCGACCLQEVGKILFGVLSLEDNRPWPTMDILCRQWVPRFPSRVSLAVGHQSWRLCSLVSLRAEGILYGLRNCMVPMEGPRKLQVPAVCYFSRLCTTAETG